VIYGGEKVFAAGADVKEMAGRNYAEMAAISRRLHASFRAVAAIGKPVVVAKAAGLAVTARGEQVRPGPDVPAQRGEAGTHPKPRREAA
jgi:hypothetical protein